MTKKKAVKRSAKATLAGLQKEMGKPRMAKSARKEYANLHFPVPLSNVGKPPGRERIEDQVEGEP
jgi:hypothetical protein